VKKNTSGLREFRDVLKNFRELSALAVKGTIAVPLTTLLAKVGPPPTYAIAALTSAMVFLTVMWVFHFWRDAGLPRLNIRMKAAAAIFCTATLASGFLLESFIKQPNGCQDPVVLGFKLRGDVTPLIGGGYTAINALQGAECDPARVWTAASITLVHISMISCWVISFMSIGAFVSTFVILNRNKSTQRNKAGIPPPV
jgi:hypothetical protein